MGLGSKKRDKHGNADKIANPVSSLERFFRVLSSATQDPSSLSQPGLTNNSNKGLARERERERRREDTVRP